MTYLNRTINTSSFLYCLVYDFNTNNFFTNKFEVFVGTYDYQRIEKVISFYLLNKKIERNSNQYKLHKQFVERGLNSEQLNHFQYKRSINCAVMYVYGEPTNKQLTYFWRCVTRNIRRT